MKYVKAFRYLVLIAVAAASIVLVYHLFFKQEVIEISSSKLSEIMNMDVDFDSYEIFEENILEIHGLTIKSPYPKRRYGEVNKYHTDWILAKINKIKLENFDYNQFIQYDRFHATNIAIDTAEVRVYRDKRLPDPPYKYKALLSTLFAKLDADIKIDTLHLRKVDITYREQTKFSPDPGKISFKSLYATGYQLTNDSSLLAQNPYFIVDARADVMGKAKIDAHMVFNLENENDLFTFSADVESFAAPLLNPVFEGVLPAKISAGQVKKIALQFSATDERARGTVDFEYKDLEFELFDDPDHKIKSIITTQIAKTALRSKNVKEENNYEQGEIYFERRKDKFIFNYWWNSLKSGLIDALLSDTADAVLKSRESKKRDQ